MKRICAALLLHFAFTVSAFAGPLLVADRSPGFTPNPESRHFELTDRGVMTLTVHNFRSQQTTTRDLGRLSPYALSRVHAQIALIGLTTPLVDKDPARPMCSDTPTVSSSIYRGSATQVIHKTVACHEWVLQAFEGQSLATFAESFLSF